MKVKYYEPFGQIYCSCCFVILLVSPSSSSSLYIWNCLLQVANPSGNNRIRLHPGSKYIGNWKKKVQLLLASLWAFLVFVVGIFVSLGCQSPQWYPWGNSSTPNPKIQRSADSAEDVSPNLFLDPWMVCHISEFATKNHQNVVVAKQKSYMDGIWVIYVV